MSWPKVIAVISVSVLLFGVSLYMKARFYSECRQHYSQTYCFVLMGR